MKCKLVLLFKSLYMDTAIVHEKHVTLMTISFFSQTKGPTRIDGNI